MWTFLGVQLIHWRRLRIPCCQLTHELCPLAFEDKRSPQIRYPNWIAVSFRWLPMFFLHWWSGSDFWPGVLTGDVPRPERGHGSPAATLTGATPAGDEREPATASQTEGLRRWKHLWTQRRSPRLRPVPSQLRQVSKWLDHPFLVSYLHYLLSSLLDFPWL